MAGKVAARARALEGKLSIGELRAMITRERGRGGQSRVNPTIPFERALDIYEAALVGRDAAEVPPAWRTDPYRRKDRMRPTLDVFTITNILRDCT